MIQQSDIIEHIRLKKIVQKDGIYQYTISIPDQEEICVSSETVGDIYSIQRRITAMNRYMGSEVFDDVNTISDLIQVFQGIQADKMHAIDQLYLIMGEKIISTPNWKISISEHLGRYVVVVMDTNFDYRVLDGYSLTSVMGTIIHEFSDCLELNPMEEEAWRETIGVQPIEQLKANGIFKDQ